MADLKDNAVNEVLKYKPVKYLITILLSVLVVAICYSLINHYLRCQNKQNSKLFWGMDECLECKIIDSTKHDVVIKHDTVHDIVNTPYFHPKKPSGKSGIKNTQKIDTGSSGLQNNAPNYGQQAGHDITNNNFGSVPRKLDINNENQLLSLLPNKNEKITITCVLGDGESFQFATQINDFLKARGYNKIDGVNQGAFTKPVIGQYFDRDSAGAKITIGSNLVK